MHLYTHTHTHAHKRLAACIDTKSVKGTPQRALKSSNFTLWWMWGNSSLWPLFKSTMTARVVLPTCVPQTWQCSKKFSESNRHKHSGFFFSKLICFHVPTSVQIHILHFKIWNKVSSFPFMYWKHLFFSSCLIKPRGLRWTRWGLCVS